MADEQLDEPIQLGQYRLGGRLAAGGMAEIYHAECVVPGRFSRPIVLKRMHKHLAEDPNFVSMFVEEARISRRLDHPNVVQLLDFEATSEGLYIILEYVDGPDLLSLLKAGARRRMGMPPEIAVYITCHLLEALDYAHSIEVNGRPLGLVHKDVSPGNVLLSRHGRVKLADFGIARASDRQRESATGTLKGKYGYMSPEQLEAKHLDGRSDIFSAGIVLAELLMSKRLFSSPNQLDVLVMVRNADLARLDSHGSHIDPALQSIIRCALERDRQDRYPTAGEFRDELAGWLASRKTRMSTAVLKKYIDELEEGGFITHASREDSTGSITMGGTGTRAAAKAAVGAARKGRRLYAQDLDLTLGAAGVTVITSGSTILHGIDELTAIDTRSPASATEALQLKSGSLNPLIPLDLIGCIYAERRTGLLTLAQNTLVKQIYFVDGHPRIVHSNDPDERLGRFLILRELLTEEQLQKALKTTQHFGGHLGNTLVGLHLLRPVDAVQLLAEQASEKLLSASSWETGRFSWQEGKSNEHKSAELKLNSCRIVARAVQLLPTQIISEWVENHKTESPDLASKAPYDEFGFGPSLSKRMLTMDGGRTIANLIATVRGKSVKVLSAAVYSLYLCQDGD